MEIPDRIKQQSCMDCLSGKSLGFEIRMAFQPINDWKMKNILDYEALVRGPNGEGADWVFNQVNDNNKYYFDQACRVKAIETASKLKLDKVLSINFLPNAMYNPETCIRATIEAADLFGFNIKQIMFEVTECEQIVNREKLVNIFDSHAKRGFITAIDDFGAGYADLSWLDDLKPQILKLDMSLIRDVDVFPKKQEYIKNILEYCSPLKTRVLAEGIESRAELDYLVGLGIDLFQGYYFAKPQLEYLVTLDDMKTSMQ